MKKFITTLAILLSLGVISLALSRSPQSAAVNVPRPRFTTIYYEPIDRLRGTGADPFLRVIHDGETGQEIVCYINDMDAYRTGASCWLSGRKW